MTTNNKTSIYDRIGGNDALIAAVEIFYDKILADPKIRHFFTGTDMTAQRHKQKIFLAYALGGPVQYTGQDIRNTHSQLKLTDEHFAAVAGHLQATLEQLNVPADLIGEVMTIVGSTHDDVLNINKKAA